MAIVAVVGLRPPVLVAQWRLVHNFPSGVVYAIYFLTEQGAPNIGFVGCGSSVYRTSDGGSNWTRLMSIGTGQVTSFCFKDQSTGWMTVMGNPGGTLAAWVTSNGGQNWGSLGFYGEASDVFYNTASGRLLLSDRANLYTSKSSSDGGQTWLSFGQDGQNGFAATEDIWGGVGSAVILSAVDQPFLISTNGGATWRSTSWTEHSWAPCSVPGTTMIYAPEDLSGNIYNSADGTNWYLAGQLPGSLTGCAQANICGGTVFVQTNAAIYVHPPNQAWTTLGGPGNMYDTRFQVVGSTIYAGDVVGNLYAFDYGSSLWPILSFNPPSVEITVAAGCGLKTASVLFKNLSCTSVTIDSAWIPDSLWQLAGKKWPFVIASGDTVRFSVSGFSTTPGTYHSEVRIHLRGKDESTATDTSLPLTLRVTGMMPPEFEALQTVLPNHCSSLDTFVRVVNRHCGTVQLISIGLADSSVFLLGSVPLPISLAADSGCLIPVRIRPQSGGTFYDTLRLTLTNAPIQLDTGVPLRTTVGRSDLSATLGSTALHFDTISKCGSKVLSTYIRNMSCDSVAITQLYLYTGDYFQVVGQPLPIWIAGGDSARVQVGFYGTLHYGPDTGNVRIMLDNGRYQEVMNLGLLGCIEPSISTLVLSDTALNLGNRSYCANDTLVSIWMHNAGCDTALCSSTHITGSSAFVILNYGDTTLPPGDSVQWRIAVHPIRKGLALGDLIIHISRTDGSMAHDTLVPLSVDVVRGAALLTCKTSALDLGTTPICQERDTFVVIQNTGCDTVCDSSVTISTGAFQLSKPWSARCLAPGERDTVWLSTVMDTNGHHGQNVATLTIASNADTALAPITLTREIQYPAAWQLTLSAPDSAYPGQHVTYKLLQHGTLPQDDTAIDFVLHYDDDLITFQSVDEPFARGAGFQPAIHGMLMHIAPVPGDSVLATLHFTAFLAPQQRTMISVDGITFSSQPTRSSDCIALAQVDTSAFTIRTLCGATEISKELNGLPLTLDAIVPNPSHNEVTLYYTLSGSESIPATVVLEDALGRTRLAQSVQLESGARRTITLDLSGVASGVYNVRLGPSVAKRIVKE